MARRSSAVSLSSLSSSTATGLSKLNRLPSISQSQSLGSNGSGDASIQWLPTRKVSVSGSIQSAIDQNGNVGVLNTDDLFTRYTVSEVRAIQQRLRADADAKQQELRLMVGERYRDLLQASTSIIEIAQSSTNVRHAFEEMKEIAAVSRAAHHPESFAAAGDEDIYLHTLQSLSAHMKLLLDAPEHLWRLMEKRRYLHAAWLFLLSRVVHQALLVEEDEEDASWSVYGISVAEQFPLVQRQWDTVSQFRTQITHKATLFLREHTLSVSDACAALLTLHLLESRPLPETVTIFLTQRTRALTTLLNRTRATLNGTASEFLNTERVGKSPHTRKAVVRNVRQKFEGALQVVSQTLGTTRTIFFKSPPHLTSLMAEVLTYITTEAPPPAWVPQDLRLTTQTLLGSLPSSTHYGLLPASIKGYKPYIDDTSTSMSTIHVQVEEQMCDWFRDAQQDLQKAADLWLSELKSVRESWVLRQQLRRWIEKGADLVPGEQSQLHLTIDTWFKKRIREIWRSEIEATKTAFQEALTFILQSHNESLNAGLPGAPDVFQLPHLPSLQNSLKPHTALASFEKYKDSLQKQILGRTAPLTYVMDALEIRLRGLHDDLDCIKDDHTDQTTAVQLLDSYQSDAESLCQNISMTLENILGTMLDVTEHSIGGVVFIGRVAAEFSSSLLFRGGLDCSEQRLVAFKKSMRSIHDRTLDRWRQYAVQDVVRRHWSPKQSAYSRYHFANEERHHGPSSAILSALVSLSCSMQEVGSSLDTERRTSWSVDTFSSFAHALLALERTTQSDMQHYQDLRLLLQVCMAWGGRMSDLLHQIQQRITPLHEKLSSEGVATDVLEDDSVSDHLSRTQMLFNTLLPPSSPQLPERQPSNVLLRFGTPSSESRFDSGIDTVKPALRLGLLLVGS